MEYPNWMTAIAKIAFESDYQPHYLLPMPAMQCLLWEELDSRPVTMEFVLPDEGAKLPDKPWRRYERLASRGEFEDSGVAHVEDAYCYGGGLGTDDTEVWYRCGYGEDSGWIVLRRP
jgi:hypothetical protein